MSNLEKVEILLKEWWRNLQFERKCSSTNNIQKIVNNSSPEIQEHARQVISKEIKKLIDKCRETKDLTDLQCFCNAVNGCFDNFTHAVDAVRILFSEIITFIDLGLAECHTKLNLRSSQKNGILELLHSFSRILILVLKLKRTQNVGKTKTSHNTLNNVINSQELENSLSELTYKIGEFLIMEDILIDTKNNLLMSGVLIREILFPDEEKLKQFNKNFISSIPTSLSDEHYKVNILKFLTSSAIINTWSVNIIDSESIFVYLKFFISLCEKYSSETPIVLNTSRTLLLLIKHESFKKFVDDFEWETVKQTTTRLLSCIFMLLEHPVACVRHSAKDFLQLLASHPSLHSIMIESVFRLPTDKRSYFISVGALASEIGSDILIQNNPELPAQLIYALSDPTIVSHVALALEFVLLKDSLAQNDFPKWCETYIVPLLISLMVVLPIVAADIEKLLEKAFKKYPNSVLYVIQKWENPISSEELRYVVTALKISQKQGFKFKNDSSKCGQFNGKDLINEKLLELCLHQKDDDLRISGFSLLIEDLKTTKLYTEKDFKLILYFFKYNLNNQQPSTRQKILGLIRKMLVRFSESKVNFSKPARSQQEQDKKDKNRLLYDEFLDSLVEFCFENIFVGCNFNRLNTVLMTLVLCFENVKDMKFNDDDTNYHWNKLLIALDSSYEENKELAVRLTRKLNLSLLDANNSKSVKLLYDKALNLCTHMEPPDVLTGSYLLQVLINLPSTKEALGSYFPHQLEFDDVHFYCILLLVQKLKEQIQLAKLDLMTAATCGPMYGALFAIRLTYKNLNFEDRLENKLLLTEWNKLLNEIIELSFEMTRIVGCVVNSSSPEGHLPMDFQTDFDGFLSLGFEEKCNIQDSQTSVPDKKNELIKIICNSFLEKFKNFEKTIQNPDCDTYESLRSLNSLIKENQLLIRKINDEFLLKSLREIENRLKVYLEKLRKTNTVVEWPATAQVLLLCAWRSIKEASLYLGDLFIKLPTESAIESGLLTKETIVRVGEELKTLLCEIKHRGAFEHAYIGFSQLVNSLWKSNDKFLSGLPKQWLKEITNQLETPITDQKVKLCSTRRSAGLPFLVQAIVCSEVISIKSTAPSSLHTTMETLLRIAENGVADNPDAKIHALNVMRALFKHAQLGEHVASYVAKALMVAIRGSRAASWSERNSSSLLFSSLVIRIFGVSRSRDEISKKNRMTSRTFFQRYSELYDFLLSEMELVYTRENQTNILYPKPSLYLVLLILGRLYPPPTEDPENIDLTEFLPYINMSRKNPTMKIRELGARALVPLISLDRLIVELNDRFLDLSEGRRICENEKHGILLQIKELLNHSKDTLENLFKDNSENLEVKWIQNTKWMLENPKKTSLTTLSTYIKVLHLLYKNISTARPPIVDLVLNSSLPKQLLDLNGTEQSLFPGIFLFLEHFYFLQTDIVVNQWLNSKERSENFVDLFSFMLKSGISEVQSIPLRTLCFALRESQKAVDFDDDDFAGIGAPIGELSVFQSKEKTQRLLSETLQNDDVKHFLVQRLSNEFKSTVIHRIWLSVVCALVSNNVVSLSHSTSQNSGLHVGFAKSLIKSGDKNLATNAFICYAIYLVEKICLREDSPEDRLALAEILTEFSSSEADSRERSAAAKIINRSFGEFLKRSQDFATDPVMLQIWMIPLKLLADEDPGVRLEISELTHKLQDYIIKEIHPAKRIMTMATLDWPHLSLVSLKAQECLLDSYINILGQENLLNLIVQMSVVALSSFSELDNVDTYPKDEFGVFEKGNPNPYCEDLALTDLICGKLREIQSVTNIRELLQTELNSAVVQFIVNCLRLPECRPRNLMEIVETVTKYVEDKEKLNGEYSIPRLQIRNFRNALNMS